MKKLLTLVLIGAFVLAALPMSSIAYFPPDHPEICMQVNGEWTGPGAPYEFEGIQYCTTFDVTVIALSFEDLYAYEFYLSWNDAYLSLVDSEVKHIHTADFVLVEETLDLGGVAGLDDTYHQAVTAVAPAEGFTGTAAIANLQFHIDNDAQWPYQVDLEFVIFNTKTSDSCTEPIDNSEQGGNVKLIPVQPTIKMLPPVTYKSDKGETFEVQFEIQDIVKMKDFFFDVYWDPEQLTTDAQNVWIKDFLPPPYLMTVIIVDEGHLLIGAEIPCEKPCINGTGELFGIRFTTLNPWDDGDPLTVDIPPYFVTPADPPEIPHPIWCPVVCWNYINIAGFISKVDGHEQWLGAPDGVRVKGPDIAFNPSTGRGPPDVLIPGGFDGKTSTKYVYNQPCPQWPGAFIIGYYEFRSIPGDLDLDSHCDIVDLSAMAKYYGRFSTDGKTPAWYKIAGFDLNGDLIIDIYDIVIVAKNICRTEPCPLYPWPIQDP